MDSRNTYEFRRKFDERDSEAFSNLTYFDKRRGNKLENFSSSGQDDYTLRIRSLISVFHAYRMVEKTTKKNNDSIHDQEDQEETISIIETLLNKVMDLQDEKDSITFTKSDLIYGNFKNQKNYSFDTEIDEMKRNLKKKSEDELKALKKMHQDRLIYIKKETVKKITNIKRRCNKRLQNVLQKLEIGAKCLDATIERFKSTSEYSDVEEFKSKCQKSLNIIHETIKNQSLFEIDPKNLSEDNDYSIDLRKHNSELTKMKELFKIKITDFKKRCKMIFAEMNEENRRNITEMKQRYALEIEELTKQCNQKPSQEELKKSFDSKISRIKSKYQLQIDTLKQEIELFKELHNVQTKELLEIKDLHGPQTEEIGTLRKNMSKTNKFVNELESKLRKLEQENVELNLTLEMERIKHEEELRNSKQVFMDEAKLLIKQEKQRLNRERIEIQKFNTELKVKLDESQQHQSSPKSPSHYLEQEYDDMNDSSIATKYVNEYNYAEIDEEVNDLKSFVESLKVSIAESRQKFNVNHFSK